MTITGSSLPTGSQYSIAAGGYAAVVTEIGAGLRSLRLDDRPLVMEFPEDSAPVGASGQLLIPWPNRIRDGRYTFDGREQHLEINEPAKDNAIHGLTRSLPWSVSSRTDSSIWMEVRLEERPGYPYVLDLVAEYSLDASRGLTVSVTAVNTGSSDAPYGIGSHAYLHVEGGLDSDFALLRVPAGHWLSVDERMIPNCEVTVAGTGYDFRGGRVLRDVTLDTAYTGIVRDADGLARISLGSGSAGATMWFGEGLEWVQLFTGDPLAEPYRRSALAVEPMSCPPNAFATGEGVVRLKPGASVTHTWGIVGGAG
jgi:aldose 1-epimerase